MRKYCDIWVYELIRLEKRSKDFYFKLEDFVILYASLFVAFLIIVYGLVKYNFDFSWGNKLYYFLTAGIIGFVIPFISKHMYEKRKRALSESTAEIKRKWKSIHRS